MTQKDNPSFLRIILRPHFLVFLLVFTYISANVSSLFAYSSEYVNWLDYIVGFWGALIALFVGLMISWRFAKSYAKDVKTPSIYLDRDMELMGFICAVVIELGFNAMNIFLHL